MKNNDTFNKILHLTGIKDKGFIAELFRLGGEFNVTQSKIKGWRTSTENPKAYAMSDEILEAFFQGLFAYRDMQKLDGVEVFNF